jgi:hypothetical protein
MLNSIESSFNNGQKVYLTALLVACSPGYFACVEINLSVGSIIPS